MSEENRRLYIHFSHNTKQIKLIKIQSWFRKHMKVQQQIISSLVDKILREPTTKTLILRQRGLAAPPLQETGRRLTCKV